MRGKQRRGFSVTYIKSSLSSFIAYTANAIFLLVSKPHRGCHRKAQSHRKQSCSPQQSQILLEEGGAEDKSSACQCARLSPSTAFPKLLLQFQTPPARFVEESPICSPGISPDPTQVIWLFNVLIARGSIVTFIQSYASARVHSPNIPMTISHYCRFELLDITGCTGFTTQNCRGSFSRKDALRSEQVA